MLGSSVCVLALLATAQAFTLPASSTRGGIAVVPLEPGTTSSHMARSMSQTTTGWDSFRDMKQMTNVPPGEEQRVYRRTVYTHDDWKKHRSQDRFFYYLLAIFKSGVYKNLGREVWTATLLATFVVVYNAVVSGYQDFEGTKQAAIISSQYLPPLTLPLTAFTLTSPSLGLLLGECRIQECSACGVEIFSQSLSSYHSLIHSLIHSHVASCFDVRRTAIQSFAPTHPTNAGTKHARIGE